MNCVTCGGQTCSVDLRCDHCTLWSADEGSHVQAYIDEWQRERGRRSQSHPRPLSLAFALMTDPFQFLNMYLMCLVSLNNHA